MSKSRNQPARSVRLNRGGVAALAALAAAAGVGLFFLYQYQERRTSAAVVATAVRLRDSGETDLAVRHLSQHLALRPKDAAALELKSRLLYGSARGNMEVYEAAKAHEQLIRTAPDAPASQDARRRLVELYIRYGEMTRTGAATQNDIALATLESRFLAAEGVARQLIERGAGDAGARRLLAMALDGLAVPGNRKALEDAAAEYRGVLAADPGDLEAAERLARLYLVRQKNLARAEGVLDGLLKARPKSPEVRLVRYRIYALARKDAKAGAELDEATRLAPDDLAVIVSAAEHALRQGDNAEARRQIEKAPASAARDTRVLLTRGLIDFGDERPEEAVDAWRRGLMASSGTSDEVTWWLAFSLLQMGRVAEARPLLSQYKRLAGEDAALYKFLDALLDEHNGRPARAISTLEDIREQIEPRWVTMVQVSRGRCYEALWDEVKALEAYSHAVQADPLAVVPRLSIAKIRMKRRPDEAVAEVERGLRQIPDDPALRIALAGALLRLEAARPAGRRRWGDFDEALALAGKAAPGSTAVPLMQADRLGLAGREDDAVALLEAAAARVPRSARVAVALADGLSRRGKPARALEVLTRAAAPGGAGDQASLRIARARALTDLFRGREARDVLIRDVEKLPSSEQAEVWVALGQLETARGDADAARRAFAEWARLLPDDPRPRLVLLDLAFDQGDGASIHARVEEVRALCGPDDVASRLARAKELLWERDAAAEPAGGPDPRLAEAGRLAGEVLADAPELPAAQLLRAQVLERQGRLDEAINGYQKAWDKGVASALPRLVDLLTRRGKYDALAGLRGADGRGAARVDVLSAQAFLRAGEAAQATRIAEQVAHDQPDSADAYRWQARMLSHLGRVEDAEAALRTMAERRPEDLDPWLALIRFQAARKRVRGVADTLARVKARVKLEPPALLEARCRWAAGETAAAAQAFEAAAAARPGDAAIKLEAARFYEESERPLEAEAALRAVIAADPVGRPAVRQLSSVLSARAGDDPAAWQSAWDVLGPERPAAETPPEDRLARAVVLSRCPDPARRGTAVARLEEVIADLPVTHPAAVASRDYLARLLLDAGQPARASQVAAVSAARGSDPASIALYARALILSKKPEAAEWQLDRLAAVSPGDPLEAGLRARAIWDRSRPVEAATALENAYRAREDVPGADVLGREAFRLLVGMGPDFLPAADRIGRKLAARNPAWSWMPALTLARRGRGGEALDLLRTASQSTGYEDLMETARVAMSVAVSTDDPDALSKADTVLAAALRAEPAADELIVMTAMLRHIQKRYDDEAALYATALEHRPENPVILNNLAWALSEGLKRPADALARIDELIKIAGRNAQALDTRGVILGRLGRHADAIRDLEEVVSREPSPLHQLHLARAYTRAGRGDDAARSRDLALAAGFDVKNVDPVERDEIQSLLKP